MKYLIYPVLLAMICFVGCAPEKKTKDRSDAIDMFHRICQLTKEYTAKITDAPDSTNWSDVCDEFEDKLEKINFSYPPDTDLLLTEGQNDTIQTLLEEFVTARDSRIKGILHPIVEEDSLGIDSTNISEIGSELSQAHASRNLGN